MRITNNDLSGVAGPESPASQEAVKTGRSQTAGAQNTQTGDRVEFSSGLGQLAKSIASYGASRAAQVQKLAAQYQSGAYTTDSLATSHAMVTEALGGAN